MDLQIQTKPNHPYNHRHSHDFCSSLHAFPNPLCIPRDSTENTLIYNYLSGKFCYFFLNNQTSQDVVQENVS